MAEKKYLVVVDTREYSSRLGKRIVGYLKQDKDFEVKVDILDVGDYYIPGGSTDILIERKTVIDLLNAAKTKRLWNQLKELLSVVDAEVYMILEGGEGMVKKFTKWSLEAFEGLKFMISHVFGIKILPTTSYGGTAILIKTIAKKVQSIEKPKKKQLKVRKNAETPQEQALYVLSQFPGINLGRAKQILERFGTLINALENVREWRSIRGIGFKTIKKVIDVLEARFDEQYNEDAE